jgi:hypothetical protein
MRGAPNRAIGGCIRHLIHAMIQCTTETSNCRENQIDIGERTNYSFTSLRCRLLSKFLENEDLRLLGGVGYGPDVGHELLVVRVLEVGVKGLNEW